MLLTKSIKMKISNKIKKNIDVDNIFYGDIGDIGDIPIKYINRTSKELITFSCDICGNENTKTYKYYNYDIGGDYDTCIKCKHFKKRKTLLEKYGVENYTNSKKRKETMIEKYGYYYNNRSKCKETCIEKYGVDNVSKSNIIKNIKKETNIKNWSVENVFQSEYIKNKIIETNLDKFGVTHNSKSSIIKQKKIDTCNKNFGVDYPTQSTIVIDKIKNNNFIKYGATSYTKTDEYKVIVKKTNNEKYGKDWYMSTTDFREKSKITNNEKYGVDYPQQNFEIFQKQQMAGFLSKKYNDLYYRGTYEIDFLLLCEKNNIEVKNGPTISYIINNKNKRYFSDFYLPKYNLICEIKSRYYFDKYIDINLIKKDATLSKGYNFIFIIDKNYNDLLNYLA